MSAPTDVTVTLDPRPRAVVSPAAALPVMGNLAFTPAGDLLVLERRWSEQRVVVHEYAPTRDGAWAESRAVALKGVRGSPVGCAVTDDGAFLAVGQKSARVYDWPSGGAVSKLPAVRHQLQCSSLGFSPSGSLVALADGGYVSPRARAVLVCDAATGAKLATIKTDEWCFVRAMMPDEATVLTVGLAIDWEFGDDETAGQRVLGCYDVATGAARWRRVLRADQLPSVDRAAGCVWVAGDEAPYLTGPLLALSLADGSVVRTVGFADGWRPGTAPPVAVGPGTVALTLRTWEHPTLRYAVVDVERGHVLVELALDDEPRGADLPPAVHAGTRRLAARVGDATQVWQLP